MFYVDFICACLGTRTAGTMTPAGRDRAPVGNTPAASHAGPASPLTPALAWHEACGPPNTRLAFTCRDGSGAPTATSGGRDGLRWEWGLRDTGPFVGLHVLSQPWEGEGSASFQERRRRWWRSWSSRWQEGGGAYGLPGEG